MPFNIGSVANVIVCGEVSGSATAKQLPTIAGGLVWVQAVSDNAGNVYVGGAGVTIPDGTTDTTSGVRLAAGKQTKIDAVNAWILNTAADVDVRVDTYAAIEDPGTPDQILAAYDSGDHIHPSTAGGAVLASTIFTALGL